ncbi:sensor histidine kinase [Emticicia sp. W12TSBA100-4]|uniref:tetratricopeptide repeat-containing sensor histidine kinase n=1 Tax=Emticicia sp. W12TSBA100-4 TaxID=3160965 RepID=UPI0033066983
MKYQIGNVFCAMALKINCLSLLLLFTYCASSFAQTGELQPLLEKLKTAKTDTNKVRLLNKIGDEYAYNDIKTARQYYKDAYELSKKLDYLRGIIRYFSSEGELLNIEGKYDQTMLLLREGVRLSIERKDRMREGIMYENMGNTFQEMQRLDSAATYYFKALPIFEGFQDSVKIANVYSDLANVFTQTDKQERALGYINQAIAISQHFEDGFYISHLVNKENILWKLRRRTEAEKVNNQIIALARKLNDVVDMADALQNQCNHDVEMKHYEKLLNHAQELAKLNPQLQSAERTTLADYWLSVAYYFNRNYQKSYSYIEEAVKKAEKLQNTEHLQQYYTHYAKVILAYKNDPILAEKFNNLSDSLREVSFNKNILKTTKELETKYETDKKERAIQQLSSENRNKKRQISLLIFSVILLSLALAFFGLWMQNRNRIRKQEQILHEQKLKQLENEKQLLASRAVLQGQDEERSRLAKDLHDGLGGILSSVKYSFQNMKTSFILDQENALAFEKSMNLLDASMAELRRVSHNMMPESLAKLGLEEALKDYIQTIDENSGINFTYQSFGLSEVELENIYKTTIFRVIQELTTNIIRHSQAKEALVQIMAKPNLINITIEDDGIGFDPQQVNSKKSMGIQNLYNRIEYLKGKIDFQTEPNAGSSYYIEMPL